MIPDKNAANELLKLAGCSDSVINHCIVVSDHARELAEKMHQNGYAVDIELVQIGAILHDIGRSRTHDIRHGVEGVILAKDFGLDDKIVDIIRTHIGAGIMPDETVLLGLPPDNYIPSTLEEKIVAHADNLVEDDSIVSISEKVEILRKKGRKENIIEKIIQLNNEIENMID
ncbi:MAG: TIGR00295 family protein [Methanosarcinales archaeon]|nr:TIGR00295 family protein [Methanosarcinales archaeon]